MKIRKVRLQNIKSYVDQEVSFHDGVNFISGINGAGKSTLIEAIGYGLFNYNPYPNIKDLIRYGAKSGAITIEFTANDERDYRVLRKIGTSILWAVFDLETDSELDLHGAKDVQEWLKEAFGIDRDIELDQLFEDVVGVPQGTFISPFLEKPTVRKKKFDGILKVEQYRHAYTNSGEARSYLNKRMDKINTDLLIRAEQTKDYDLVKNEITQLEKQIEQLTGNLKELTVDIKNKDAEIKHIEAIRTQLEKSASDIKAAQEKVKGLQQKQQLFTANLTRAREAKTLLQTSEVGFKGFIELEEILKTLDTKRMEKEKLEKEHNRLQQEIATLEGRIKQSELTITKQLLETAETKENTSRQVQELSEVLKQLKVELSQTEVQKTLISGWQQAEDTLKERFDQMDETRRNVSSKEEQINLLTIEENKLAELLKSLPAIELLANTLETKDKVLAKAREDYEVLKAKLQTLEKNLKQSKGGLCPFLDSPCQNVQGNLEEYFSNQIAETEKEMQNLTTKGVQAKKERDEAASARDNLIKLRGEQERSNQVKTQKEKYLSDIHQLLTKVTILNIPDCLDNLNKLSGIYYARLEETTQNFVDIAREELLNIKISKLDSTLSGLQDILATSKDNREAKTSVLNDEMKLRSNQLAQTQANHNNASGNLKQLIAKEEELAKVTASLKAEKTKNTQLNIQLKTLEEALGVYQGLNDQINQTRTRQNQYRKDYDTYRQNQVEAEKVEILQGEVDKVTKEIAETQNWLIELEETKTQLSAQFNPDDHQQKKDHLDNLKQEEAAKKQIQKERQNDLNQSHTKLAEMEKVLKIIDKLKNDMAKDQKTLSLLDIVRNILNRSGPPIAKVYLQSLSREANDLYRQVSKENVALEWLEGYEIALFDSFNGQKRERTFKQFSGGEQMTAALAVRLALLKQQSRVKVGFFDEPTANLDSERRLNLAETIPRVTGGFDQIFIISHDDTFDEITENVIHLQKDQGEGSSLQP